eukprot:633663-Rhodomonas_salina.1
MGVVQASTVQQEKRRVRFSGWQEQTTYDSKIPTGHWVSAKPSTFNTSPNPTKLGFDDMLRALN